MIYKEKTITLKNGQTCLLRSPTAKDAEDMLLYLRQTSGETDFMARYADEFSMTVEEECQILSDICADPARIMIAAFIDGRLVANAGFSQCAHYERAAHRLEFGMSIIAAFWGLGIGSALLTELIGAAKTAGFEQLELEVVAENTRAIALYEKFGFVRFGTRPDTFKYRDGRHSACHLMLKKL